MLFRSECAEEIKSSYGVEVSVLRADSTEKQSIDIIDSYLRTSGKQLDTVVFNAAVTLRTSFEETTFEQWDRVFYANVHFPVFLLQKIGLRPRARRSSGRPFHKNGRLHPPYCIFIVPAAAGTGPSSAPAESPEAS